jgi:hypothetical protein
MAEEDLVQLNAGVMPRIKQMADGLAEEYNLTRRQVVSNAVELYAAVMGMVEQGSVEATDPQHPTKLAGLHMRIAREAPAALVGLRQVGYTESDAGPVIHLDGWKVWKDPETPDLLIASEDGQKWGRFVDGEIRLVRLPTAAEVATN